MDLFTAIVRGVPLTLGITAASFTLGALLALPLAAGLRARHRAARIPVRLVVDVVRGIPILVWLFLLYFGLSVGAFRLDAVQAAVLTLGGVSAAYLAETYRGAVAAVDRGQWEASRALALPRAAAFATVIAPQAARIALPTATTFALTLLKDSSIPSVIGVTEVAFRTVEQARSTGQGLPAYGVAVALYIVISVPVALLSRYLDHRLRKKVAR
ncbi:amino acid ABC transporter permease [Streptomyces paludis]|uniref:Amino acid ABC transporter permease n=1 Tax=Streptomyces paludis TaxID=2282738 RepID=A0A345HVZ5_9ACTN|nr:amino acid ABC transporter permease [Streptomyces paludis]AXG80869.1 amino acid ABC transporter permease [Streptomyces paludis]